MKYLRILLCLALVLAGSNLMAAPGLEVIQKKISSAGNLWDTDAQKAQTMLHEAFSEAIAWTTSEYVDRVREQGFFTAITCFSPELIDEVATAADTYIKLFPQGRNIRKVYLYRAMTAWAVQDADSAEKALNAAANAGKLAYSEQSYILSANLSSGRHRTAERFIEGQRISRPSRKLTRDLRRFHSGNRLVEGVMNRVKDGKISGQKAVELLEDAVSRAWFAKRAPEAALSIIALKDDQAPHYNSVMTEWCGLKRVVKHASSPQLRLMKLENFLNSFPEASPEELYRAIIDLRYLKEYEFRDAAGVQSAIDDLNSRPALAAKAEIEALVSGFTPEKMATAEGNDDLQRLLKMADRLPYDNGHLPVVTREYLEFMLAISDMAIGRVSRIDNLPFKVWKDLPLEMLYQIATGKKEKAYTTFQQIKSGLSPQICKMIEYVMMPLYMPVRAKDRVFLAGLAAVEKFPDLGTDLLVEAVSGQPRMFKAEHGLAVLSDVYNRHMAFAEAQSVWNLLAKLYPDSIWLK